MRAEESLLEHFADLNDPRKEKNRKHPLINVIGIAILGVICGADTWVEIERYGNAKREWLASFLDLSNGIPSHDTFGRVFRWLDPQAFQERFTEWTEILCRLSKGEVVALDGKKLRRSFDKPHGKNGIWMVSAWAGENRLVLGQMKVDEKSNEITAVPQLLARLDIRDCVVTVDALGTQVKTAEQIIAAQGDYIFPVKPNQGTLHEDLQLLFDGFEQDAYRDTPHQTIKSSHDGHDRQESRQCWVVWQPEHIAYLRRANDWPRLTCLVKLLTVRSTPQKTEVTTRYFISSWMASASDFLQRIRDHWQIENGLHWVLDMAFREDESRIRKDHAPQNMATIRHIALNLLKQNTSVKVGIAAKRKMAAWDNSFLISVLCP